MPEQGRAGDIDQQANDLFVAVLAGMEPFHQQDHETGQGEVNDRHAEPKGQAVFILESGGGLAGDRRSTSP